MPCIGTSLKRRNAGTIKNPPPTPSKPVSKPDTAPIQASVVEHLVSHTNRPVSGLIRQFLPCAASISEQPSTAWRNIRLDTNIMITANKVISAAAGNNLAR